MGENWAGINNLYGKYSGKVKSCYNISISIIERNSMEQNADTGTQMTPVVDDKKKMEMV